MNLNLLGLGGITEFFAIETHSNVRVYRVCCGMNQLSTVEKGVINLVIVIRSNSLNARKKKILGTMTKVIFTFTVHTQVYDTVHTAGGTQIFIDRQLYRFYNFASGIVYVKSVACNLNLHIAIFVS